MSSPRRRLDAHVVKNLSIGARLGLGFGIVLLMMAALIGTSLSRMAAINAELLDIVDDNNVKFAAAADMRDAQRRSAIAVRSQVLAAEPAGKEEQSKLISNALADYDSAMALLGSKVDSVAGKALIDRITAAKSRSLAPFDRAHRLALAGDASESSRGLMAEVIPAAALWRVPS
jgi:methyl-accepting chemotaxis protein